MSSFPRRSPRRHPPFCHLREFGGSSQEDCSQVVPCKEEDQGVLGDVWHAALDGGAIPGDPPHPPPLPRH